MRIDPRAPWANPATRTNGVERPELTRFALIGAGWRSRIFTDLARALPDQFTLTGVLVRRPDAARERLGAGTPLVSDIEELLSPAPDLVVVCVSQDAVPPWIESLVSRGVPVLAETPPAPDLDGVRSLWERVGSSGLVQVAEQYLRMPENAAALSVVRSGLLGTPTSVHVSSTHGYHAVSMIRGLLGAGTAPATVRTHRRRARVLDPLTPEGWTGSVEPVERTTTLATIDLDGIGNGLYDFTDNQWWNPLRTDHLTVRGTHGELRDGTLMRMADPRTVVTSRLHRAATGRGMNLEGADTTSVSLDGQVLFRSPFEGARFSDDEIAVAQIVAESGSWARRVTAGADAGPGPYPLAEACHDQAISLAIDAAEPAPVRVEAEPWMK